MIIGRGLHMRNHRTAILSEAHVRRIYTQGVDEAVVRLVHRLADRIEELEAQLVRDVPRSVLVNSAG